MATVHDDKDLDAILATVREVEASLARRGARAMGATMIVWGLGVAAIFAYEHFYHAAPGPFIEALGAVAAQWVWLGPVALAYALTAVCGARMGRINEPFAAWRARTLLIVLLPALLVQVLSSVTGVGEALTPGMWVAFLGFILVLLRPRADNERGARLFAFVAAASFVVGVALLAPPLYPSSHLVASAWYALALGGLGLFVYHRGGR